MALCAVAEQVDRASALSRQILQQLVGQHWCGVSPGDIQSQTRQIYGLQTGVATGVDTRKGLQIHSHIQCHTVVVQWRLTLMPSAAILPSVSEAVAVDELESGPDANCLAVKSAASRAWLNGLSNRT